MVEPEPDPAPGGGRAALFAYGTLMDPVVLAVVAGPGGTPGRQPGPLPAVLPGYARYRIQGEVYPGIVEAPGAAGVEGLYYPDLDRRAWLILDAFEGELYRRVPVRVQVGDRSGDGRGRGPRGARGTGAETATATAAALAYVVRASRRSDVIGRGWSFEEFTRLHRQDYLKSCRQWSREFHRQLD